MLRILELGCLLAGDRGTRLKLRQGDEVKTVKAQLSEIHEMIYHSLLELFDGS
jgi:hypothetical protein